MSDGMSDEDLDREWQPQKQRPQSTMARSFSLALNDLFKIDNSIADLDAAVSEKKRAVSSQESELEALEARLRATEERLKKAASTGISPAKSSTGRSSPRQRAALGEDTFAASPTKEDAPRSPLAAEDNQSPRPDTPGRPRTGNSGRPNSGWKQEAHASYTAAGMPGPGALPPTPDRSESSAGESEPDYVVVRGERKRADTEEEGDVPPPPPEK